MEKGIKDIFNEYFELMNEYNEKYKNFLLNRTLNKIKLEFNKIDTLLLKIQESYSCSYSCSCSCSDSCSDSETGIEPLLMIKNQVSRNSCQSIVNMLIDFIPIINNSIIELTENAALETQLEIECIIQILIKTSRLNIEIANLVWIFNYEFGLYIQFPIGFPKLHFLLIR